MFIIEYLENTNMAKKKVKVTQSYYVYSIYNLFFLMCDHPLQPHFLLLYHMPLFM